MTDTVYLRRGNSFFLRQGAPAEHQQLPPGTYSVDACPDHGLHLSVIDDIGAPGKLYGSTDKRAERVLSSFMARPGITTGVLLTGTKGTGKTLLAKRIIEKARMKHKIPALVISAAYGGPGFLQFMAAIDQPCIVFIDEVEKVYDEPEKQNQLLALLDGAYSNHKLFILVCNKNTLIDTLQNRPGRLHYRWAYNRLERDVVKSYAEDTLKNKEHAAGLLRMMDLVTYSTFDVLKGLVWEMNQYGENAGEAISNLNIDYSSAQSYYGTAKAIAGEYQGREWAVHVQLAGIETSCDLRLVKFDYRRISEEQVVVYNRIKTLQYEQSNQSGGPSHTWTPVTVKQFQDLRLPIEQMAISTYEVDRVRHLLTAEEQEVANLFAEQIPLQLKDEDLAQEDYASGAMHYHAGDFVVELAISQQPLPESEDGHERSRPSWAQPAPTAAAGWFAEGRSKNKPGTAAGPNAQFGKFGKK